jgi:hypothetical protein
MAAIGSSLLPLSPLLTAPGVANHSLTLANTEYAISLPTAVRQLTMRLRDNAVLKMATTSGDISSNLYFTVNLGEAYSVESVGGSGTITLYVSVSKPSQVLEIFYWT